MLDSADLVGIEIGLDTAKAAVLSSDACSLMRFAETGIEAAAPGNELPNFDEAIKTLWSELGLDLSTSVRTAVAISHKHSGIGSGPTIEAWIDDLSESLGSDLTRIGEKFEGISYFPDELLGELSAAFKALDIKVDRIELAPTAAARCFEPKTTCSFTAKSGVGWLARLHSGLLLEALVSETSTEPDGVAITRGETVGPISHIYGLDLTSEQLASLRVKTHEIAIAVGAARGLLDRLGGNLLEGTRSSPSISATQGETTEPVPAAAFASPSGTVETPAPQRQNYRPLPPQHTQAASTASSNGKVTAKQIQLEPHDKRSGFDPTETKAAFPTPAFLPPTETTMGKKTVGEKTDREPTAEPPNGPITAGERNPKTRKASDSAASKGDRPKIDTGEFKPKTFISDTRPNSKAKSEPKTKPETRSRSGSRSNLDLKLLTIVLAALAVIGLLILLSGPN